MKKKQLFSKTGMKNHQSDHLDCKFQKTGYESRSIIIPNKFFPKRNHYQTSLLIQNPNDEFGTGLAWLLFAPKLKF